MLFQFRSPGRGPSGGWPVLWRKVATFCQSEVNWSDAALPGAPLLRDLARKTPVLTGARQVGKTTLARQLMEHFERAQTLIWDGPA